MSLLTLDNSMIYLSSLNNFTTVDAVCFSKIIRSGKVIFNYNNPKSIDSAYSVLKWFTINSTAYCFIGNYFYNESQNIVTTEGLYVNANGTKIGSTTGTYDSPGAESDLQDFDSSNCFIIFNKTGDDQVDTEEGLLNSILINNVISFLPVSNAKTIFRQDNFEDKYDGTSTITMPTTYPTYNPDGTSNISNISS